MKKLKEKLEENEKEMVADLIKRMGEVKACSNCGGLGLTVPPTIIDVSVGLRSLPAGSYYCRDCGYEGIPTAFDKEKAYEKFFELRREKYNKGEGLEVSSNLASRSLRKD